MSGRAGGRLMGFLARFLDSRWYVAFSSSLTLVLLGGVSVSLLSREGMWPPALPQGHAGVIITGPGATATSQAGYVHVYIVGAVQAPGEYTLPAADHVSDLIAAAGGLLVDADVTRVDMAAPVADGQELYVPRVGETMPVTLGGKVLLNQASAQDLHEALGISLSIAQHIVAYRTAHGPFTAVSQLLLVPVSRTTYDRIKDLVTI